LIQIKDTQNYFGHSRFCKSPSSPASKVMRNTSKITAVPSGNGLLSQHRLCISRRNRRGNRRG
jgi:hypothetical protein